MEKYMQPKYIFGIVFGIVVVYLLNKNVDNLFQSRLVENAKPLATEVTPHHEQGSIDTH